MQERLMFFERMKRGQTLSDSHKIKIELAAALRRKVAPRGGPSREASGRNVG